MHANSYELCRQFAIGLQLHMGSIKTADVGSYDVNGCYRQLFDGRGPYVGFDIQPGPNVDVVLPSLYGWKLSSVHEGAFDVVISGQCVEHVAYPWRWIKDVARLMRNNGLLWLCAPNTEVFHEHPIDAWRVWPDGMKALFEEAGLITEHCRAYGPDTMGIARKPNR
jgi:SAM-dependent methyltransferase